LADIRTRLFNHIFNQDHAFFTRNPTGDLVSRLTSDIDSVNAVLSTSLVIILVEGVTLIVIVTVMLVVNWRLALLSLAVFPIFAIITRYFRKRIRLSSSGERSAQARISAFLNEQLHGMTVVQLFGHQEKSEQEFDIYNSQYRNALIVLRKHSAVFLSIQEILSAFGLGLLLYGGGQGVLAGWATLGMLVAFIQYTDRAVQPVLKLSQEYNTIQIALGAAERIYRMLQVTSQIQSPAQPLSLPRVRGAIEFRDVHLAYLPDEPVLQGISLKIPPGQSVAIVGATGAGKSSLVSLLARNYDPQRGQILLDGVDIRQLELTELRRTVAVVPQDPICLAGSIRHNICLYRQDIPEAQLHQAAEFSNAARFIEQLPGGYDFELLPDGANLSQGQRQLLSLARALALSPEGVLVLDEATSSIDTATEKLIQEALDRILRSRTSLVIAHRLSTIRGADRIIVMDKGKIVEDGDHHSLLARNGYYARLYHHQLMPEEVAQPEVKDLVTALK
jgi:ATP-binding cassette subfamily B protein